MCKHCGGSIDHLLLHCEVATEVWNVFFQLFGVSWVMPRKVSDILESWRGQMGNRHVLCVWRLVSSCGCAVYGENRMHTTLRIMRAA
jgi:hypothetical protein